MSDHGVLRPGPGRSHRRYGLVYGPAALQAAARGDRLIWALHRAALGQGFVPVVPAVVVLDAARVVGTDPDLASFLAGTEIEALDAAHAFELGVLGQAAGADNPSTIAVVECAARRMVAAVTARSPGTAELAGVLGHDLVLHPV
ncbi:MAG: hypothetical protein M0Z93_05225 [Actinomycetota bacterium]|nr:hypothetical protein [Actinomycetota bacterium]